MAGTLVFIFIVDHLPGTIVNKTLETIEVTKTAPTHFQFCDHMITDPLMQITSRELNVLMIPVWMQPNDDNKRSSTNIPELDQDSAEAQSNEYSFEILEDANKVEITPMATSLSSEAYYDDLSEFEENLKGNATVPADDSPNQFLSESKVLQKGREITYMSKSSLILNQTKELNSDKDAEIYHLRSDPSAVRLLTDLEKNTKHLINEMLIKENPLVEELNLLDESKHSMTDPFTTYGVSRLVAIFESVANVTAQTCGGTLVSSHWVLTTASCVNLLDYTLSNSTKDKSVYTIIVNASDPLTDGTAHNVTEIHIHSESKDLIQDVVSETIVLQDLDENSIRGNTKDNASEQATKTKVETNDRGIRSVNVSNANISFNTTEKKDSDSCTNSGVKLNSTQPKNVYTKNLSMVLMKINPPVDVAGVHILLDTSQKILQVLVYGWTLMADESGNDTMQPATYEADMLSSEECSKRFNIPESRVRDEVCLTSRNVSDDALSMQVNWGGPIFTPLGVLVGVAHADGEAPFTGIPLEPYINWIISTLLPRTNPTDDINYNSSTEIYPTSDEDFI